MTGKDSMTSALPVRSVSQAWATAIYCKFTIKTTMKWRNTRYVHNPLCSSDTRLHDSRREKIGNPSW